MKAFYVIYDTASSTRFSEVLLVVEEKDIEVALEAKSIKHFKVGAPYSKITSKKEIPLSQVKLSELSITEFLQLNDKEIPSGGKPKLELGEVKATMGIMEKMIADKSVSEMVFGVMMKFIAEAYLDTSGKYNEEMQMIEDSRKKFEVGE